VDGAQKAAVLNALMKAEPHAAHFDVSAPAHLPHQGVDAVFGQAARLRPWLNG